MESDPSVFAAVARVFREARADLFLATSLEAAEAILSALKLDAVVIDGGLPPEHARQTLTLARTLQPDVRCFVLVDDLGDEAPSDATPLARVWFDELSAG